MEGLEARQLLAGDGLTATYFLGNDFNQAVVSRIDPQVQFDWTTASPDAGLPRQSFGVRWTGQVLAPSGGPVTFHVDADEGVRLWVDGQLLIDGSGFPGERSGAISLQQGIAYDITLEYVQTNGPSSCVLSWSSPTLAKEVIPQAALDSGEPGRGLTGTYFLGENLAEPILTRVDADVNFDWGMSSPDPSVPVNGFSARWAGQVLIPRTETYTFSTYSDDGVRLWVDGKLLIDHWAVHPETLDTGSIALQAGQKYDIVLEYFERAGGASVKLLWSSPTIPRQSIPTTNLFPAGNGSGLTATYFNDPNFQSPALTRTDPSVRFDWRGGSPAAGVSADFFSVRWTGRILARETAPTTFFVNSDDGARLWVDGQLVVDKWGALGEKAGAIQLVAGQSYDIVLEYVEWQGSAECALSWSTPHSPKSLVPASSLSPSGAGTGLIGTYFNGTDLANPVVSRLDPKVAFDWWRDGPAAGVSADGFSARWTGQVLAPQTAAYTFFTNADDGVRLWVDGQLVINDWNIHPLAESSGAIDLVAGRSHDIVLEYYEAAGAAAVSLSWSTPGLPRQVIPSTSLFPNGTDRGLTATYFRDTSLSIPALTRVDPLVNFNWAAGSPGQAVPNNGFSARWTGQVLAKYTELYTFWTRGDDGVRLWVDGQLVIDDWNTHAPADRSGTVALVAGKRHDIRMEYYEGNGGASVSLLWSSPSQSREVIPRAVLFPNALATTTASTSTSGPTPPPLPGDWSLAFREEFDTVDPRVWGNRPWWGNNGGYDSRYSTDNLSLFNGVLTMTAKEETSTLLNGQTKSYTSGYLATTGVKGVSPTSYAFQYGYAEIRARAAVGSGLWSAFWMLPASTKSDHLEIDAMESQGWNTRQYTGGYHQWASGSGPWGSWDLPFDITEDFHTYGVDWRPDRLSFYVDGVEMARLSDPIQIPQQAMYLIVSLEITNWAWIGGVNVDGSGMAVDYVRVWQRDAATTPAPLVPPAEVPLKNAGFESPSLPGPTFSLNPAQSGWTFQGAAGVQADGSAWRASKVPEGRQSAFLQGGSAGSTGRMSQTVKTGAGRFQLTFQAAQREGFGAQPVNVLVDGRIVATVSPSWTSFNAFQTPEFDLTAGDHVITLAATTPQAGQVSLIDAVRLVKVSGPLEGGWTARDIGDPMVSGESTVDNGAFLVSGSGSDIGGLDDEFQFVARGVSGNATLSARMTRQTRTDDLAKAGLMFRASEAPHAAFVAVVKTPANSLILIWRDATGQVGRLQGPVIGSSVTFRLIRRGNTFTAFYSTDGRTYNQVGGAVTVAMPAEALAGLAVTSHNPLAKSASTFDFVSLTNP